MMSSCCAADPYEGYKFDTSEPQTSFDELVRGLVGAHEQEVRSLREQILRLHRSTAVELVQSEQASPSIFVDNASCEAVTPEGPPEPQAENDGRQLDVWQQDLQQEDQQDTQQDEPPRASKRNSKKSSCQKQFTEPEKTLLANISLPDPEIFPDAMQLVDPASGIQPKLKHTTSHHKIVHKIGNLNLDPAESNNIRAFLNGNLDIFMSLVILLNAVVFFVQLWFTGVAVGFRRGYEISIIWADADYFFYVIEHIFQAIYVLELGLRLCVLRWEFFYNHNLEQVHGNDIVRRRMNSFNVFDAVVVMLGNWDLYVVPALGLEGSNLSFVRLIRLARLSRTLKVVRVLKVFSKLRVLVSTVAMSVLALFWSMFLLLLLIFISALFLCQVLQPAILNGDLNETTRVWLYEFYGTPPRAFWTLFEVTVGGEGASLFRPLIKQVHWGLGIFCAFYLSCVVFAVINIIQALFLKDTLDMAANDAEMMVQELLDQKRAYSERLGELFYAADTSGDGVISLEEFENVIMNPKVMGFLTMLELEISEVKALFHMLDDGDGSIDYQEFLDGVIRLKGQARSMDVIAVMADCRKILDVVEGIGKRLEQQNDAAFAVEEVKRSIVA